MTDTIRVMTWNVHGTFNLNPNFDLEAVCSIIRKWSPDIADIAFEAQGEKGERRKVGVNKALIFP